MKRIVLFGLLLACLAPAGAHGFGLVLGIKGGAGYTGYLGADYNNDLDRDYMENALKLGYVAGVFASLEFLQVLSLQPEFLLVRTGNAASEEASFWGPYDGTVRHVDVLTYYSIPLLLKFRTTMLSVSAGSAMLLKAANGKAVLRSTDAALQETFDTMGLASMEYGDDAFAPVVYTAIFAIELDRPIKFLGGEWNVETRVQYAFTNLHGDSQSSNYKLLEIMVLASYGIRIFGSIEDRRSKIR